MSFVFRYIKRAREEKRQEAERFALRQRALRARLHQTVGSVVDELAHRHDLQWECVERLARESKRIVQGIDLVLIDGLDAYSKDIPEHLQGGAIIGQSADAFSHAAIMVDNHDLEAVMGSTQDGETIGHIHYQLGFNRDGSLRS